jgi:predicted dehydrogenase
MRVLIIGLGSIGKKHVHAIRTLFPDVQILALRSQIEAEIYPGVINIYDFNEISSLDVDFAIISNPTSKHKETIEQLIAFHLPLFIEKPLSSILDMEGTIDLVNKENIQTYVACNLRFLDCIKSVEENIHRLPNRKLNEVNVYCGSYLPDWRPGSDYRKTYSANAELGGGVHIDLIHELDYLYWIFGTPNMSVKNFKSQSSLSISAFDYANYLLDYNGFCANVVLNYYRKDPKRNFELVFEDETWNVDLLKNQITCSDQIIYSSEQLMLDTYQVQMEYYVNCLKNRTNTFNTISDAYEVLKICLEK